MKQTTVSIAVKISNGSNPAVASQEFPLPRFVKDNDLSPLAEKVIRAAAHAAGVEIQKVKVEP